MKADKIQNPSYSGQPGDPAGCPYSPSSKAEIRDFPTSLPPEFRPSNGMLPSFIPPMKSTIHVVDLSPAVRHPRGFALIVTLSLMILLTVVAVGLLSLSSVSLRSTSQSDSLQSARANARTALMLAIGDLQKQLGPDTRISAPADQISASDASVSTTPQAQRQWAGAYKSWPAAIPSAARPTPEFLQWFVSGDPEKLKTKDFAGTAASAKSVELVTKNTVGPDGDPVRVPTISQNAANGMKNTFAWWVSDQGTKALITPANEIPTAIANVRADQQVAPATNFRSATSGTTQPFSLVSLSDERISRVTTWQSSALLTEKPDGVRGFFHDFTCQNSGLLTNVRAGGFRKDLSMQLERPAATAPASTSTALYTVGNEPGINLQELWVYYNLHKDLIRSGTSTFTTGGSISSGTPFLRVESSPAACQTDDEFFMKQPVIINYQLALSFETRVVTNASGQSVTRLHLVADPILTFWNPLDVPVAIPSSAYLSVKYWQIPYDLVISRNGSTLPGRFPLVSSLSGGINGSNGDGNFVSVRIGQSQPLAFKPGEVIKVSQVGNEIVKGSSPVDHELVAKAGFNYGGGVSVPVRDTSGNYVDLSASDVITFQAKPNNLTAGSTALSGHSLNGSANHTRHFSMVHHEVYIGADRGDSSTSLGIGGMFIDWDFGNKRLKYNEDRGSTSSGPGVAGTKSAAARLYADSTALKNIFPTITGRPLPVSILSSAKQPVMLFSFAAKTESGSNLGTRSLSRFNPRTLHVDFYDLGQRERDMLPYEYSVESLSSWKNRSLEVSTNGNAYFGGGLTAADGTSFVTTHSIPREPIVSLAAFQYSFANGFDIQRPKYGYGTLNAREPMLPQISHAIGNSTACPVLASNTTEGTLPGGRPMADHSYLANQALWDDWFLSGIAPQGYNTFSKARPQQKLVAQEFFNGTAPLPVVRYRPDLRGQDAAKVLNTYFPSTTPATTAIANIASSIRVDGLFNVNSTSVEAWKSLLGARKERPIVIRDANGKETVKTDGEETPIAGLLAPLNAVAKGTGSVDSQSNEQWVGRRTLDDDEIDKLARAIVREVRKRGPFLSLADFINRRVGQDKELAHAGAIQSALESTEAGINSAYQTGARAVGSTASGRFAFPEAEQGPLSSGAPGIIKQADILTPIAPILAARSDSFLIRAYGEKTDSTGKVIARACCEAVVRRSAAFVDPTDPPEKTYGSITTINKNFGRRFEMVSFRWLSSDEI